MTFYVSIYIPSLFTGLQKYPILHCVTVFFTIVYISSSFVLGAVFNVISVNIFSTPYLPPILALGISLLLISKIVLNLDSIIIKLGFIPEAVYYYSLMG